MTFSVQYFNEMKEIIDRIDQESIEKTARLLADVRQSGGRLFLLGVGGSAAAASHAVNDFRKIAGFEAYAPTDNVSELTARTNDEGWESVFKAWLEGSRLNKNDALMIYSVGGGNKEKNVSVNLINAIQYAKEVGAKVTGVVGRDGGYTAKSADVCVVIPVVNPDHITPHTESFHCVVSHLLVSHPLLSAKPTKWESIK
jgi:D-sedoheptulose 7-phosphate isomerase